MGVPVKKSYLKRGAAKERPRPTLLKQAGFLNAGDPWRHRDYQQCIGLLSFGTKMSSGGRC